MIKQTRREFLSLLLSVPAVCFLPTSLPDTAANAEKDKYGFILINGWILKKSDLSYGAEAL